MRLTTHFAHSTTRAAVTALVVLWGARARAKDTGLRWSGDARVAVSTQGASALGPTLRFRYGEGTLPRIRVAVDSNLRSEEFE